MKTQVAIIGAGEVSEYHFNVLQSIKGVEVVAICDLDIAKAKKLARPNKIEAYAMVEQLLQNQKIDAAHILVPPPHHFAVARTLLGNGVDLLIEKPMVLSSDEGKELVELAKQHHARLACNHNYIFHPLFLRLKKDLAAMRIGNVDHMVSYDNAIMLPTKNIGRWMFAAPQNIIFERGPHPLSQIREIMGKLLDVTSRPAKYTQLINGNDFYQTWQLILQCEKGHAFLYYNFNGEHAASWTHVMGQDGSIFIDWINNTYMLQEKWKYGTIEIMQHFQNTSANAWRLARQSWKNLINYGLTLIQLKGRTDGFYQSMENSIRNFHHSVNHKEKVATSGEDAVEILETLEKAVVDISKPEQTITITQVEQPGTTSEEEILVIGATGFIGSLLVKKLLAKDKVVRVLTRNTLGLPAFMRHRNVRIYRGDLADEESIRKAVKGAHSVYHLAMGNGGGWKNTRLIYVEGTRNLAITCSEFGVKRFYFTSSSAAYYLGGRTAITEEIPVDQKSFKRNEYTRAKVECERILWQMYKEKKLPVVIFRPAVVVGQRGQLLHSAVGTWVCGLHCIGWGRGNIPLPFVLVEDVVAALVNALDVEEIEGQCFNLAGDVRPTACEYIQFLRKATGRNFQFHPQSLVTTLCINIVKWLIKKAARKKENPFPSYRDLKSRSMRAQWDCSKAKNILGWEPVHSFDQFIQQAILVHTNK